MSSSGASSSGGSPWITDPNTWTYASATSFTVGSSDLTATYTKGLYVRLTQSTVKYFVVTSSSFGGGTTTVNITGGTDYTLANAAITVNGYSYMLNPPGWPTWFNYSPSPTGFSGTPTTTARFAVQGTICTVYIDVTGTSNAAATGFSLPINCGNSDGPVAPVPYIQNNGTPVYSSAVAELPTSGKSVSVVYPSGFATSGTKVFDATFQYQI